MEICQKVTSAYVSSVNGLFVAKPCRSLRKPYAPVHARNGSRQDSEESVTKAESRCISDAHTKRFEAPAEQDDGVIDEGLILEFEKETDQVASGLSVISKVVSEVFHCSYYLTSFGFFGLFCNLNLNEQRFGQHGYN